MSVIVVSGLPRSGTSLMMQMLQAGGVPLLTDEQRPADPDNPRGYFEYEPVKSLQRDSSWLHAAEGKALKIISALLPYLPSDRSYRVILMQRPLGEVLASQRAMLQRLGRRGSDAGEAVLTEIFLRQSVELARWLKARKHLTVMTVNYRDAVVQPQAAAAAVTHFLDLSPGAAAAMVRVADPGLYRQRR